MRCTAPAASGAWRWLGEFGKYDAAGALIPAAMDLVRLAIPRGVYTQSHIDHVVQSFARVVAERDRATGFRITKEPRFLGHFTAHFEPLT